VAIPETSPEFRLWQTFAFSAQQTTTDAPGRMSDHSNYPLHNVNARRREGEKERMVFHEDKLTQLDISYGIGSTLVVGTRNACRGFEHCTFLFHI